jgi:hypothetical protein
MIFIPCMFTKSAHAKDHRGVDLISDALPYGRLWYVEPNAISYAKFRSSRTLHSPALRPTILTPAFVLTGGGDG